MCPHDDAAACGCRKPAPGLLLAAARELGIDLDHSFLVGDRWQDIEAGHRAGCRTVLVDYGYREGYGNVVILAGGLGTRMRRFTATMPKALVPVAGRPFVEWQLEWLAANGATDILLCVGYLGSMLTGHVGDGRRFGVKAFPRSTKGTC